MTEILIEHVHGIQAPSPPSLSLSGISGRNRRLRRLEATRGPAPTGEPLSFSPPPPKLQ